MKLPRCGAGLSCRRGRLRADVRSPRHTVRFDAVAGGNGATERPRPPCVLCGRFTGIASRTPAGTASSARAPANRLRAARPPAHKGRREALRHLDARIVRTYVRDMGRPSRRTTPASPRRQEPHQRRAGRVRDRFHLTRPGPELVEMYAEKGDPKYQRAALKYLTRYMAEGSRSLSDVAQSPRSSRSAGCSCGGCRWSELQLEQNRPRSREW